MATKKYNINTNKNKKGFTTDCVIPKQISLSCPDNLLSNSTTTPSQSALSAIDTGNSVINKIYRNRFAINQRGGSIVINNTTDDESVHISHRSGSNFNINNNVNTELATNNKQIMVQNDKFETVKNDSVEFIGGDYNLRVGGTSYIYKGYKDETEIRAHDEWKDVFKKIADNNSKFKIKRGGYSLPNGQPTEMDGERSNNPVIGSQVFVVENLFAGYQSIPTVTSNIDEVATYKPIKNRVGTPPSIKTIKKEDIAKSAGNSGSKAPGVLEFGAEKSASTENGKWIENADVLNMEEQVLEAQSILTEIEGRMGDGGDEHLITKRNKFETVGAVFNDYPSVKIDEKGRSQPFEMLVSDTGTYKNHDAIPILEEVDNSSNFPCGNDTKIIGNSYKRNVGSGGISMKTSGTYEMGGTILRGGFKQIILNSSHGIHIGSENGVEIQSLKTITLRTARQVYVESSLGVKNNLIVGGGLSVEGETYLQHVTAPLEVQQTENTVVQGKFSTSLPLTLRIGTAVVPGIGLCPVFAEPLDNLITIYPHSHHFNNLPLNLMASNKDVRKEAHVNGINKHDSIAPSFPQVHEKKYPRVVN